jgi:quinol monooxygenase YgiN
VIRTILTLTAAPEQVAEVVAQFHKQGILQHSLDHSDAISSEIGVATDGSGTIVVLALWPNLEAYDGWVQNPWRAESNKRVAEFLKDATVGIGQTFEIDHAVSKQ